MVIVGGLRSPILAQALPHLRCEQCSSEGGLEMHIYSKFLHIFLIPFLPLGNTGFSLCRKCNSQLVEQQMSEALRREFAQAKATAKPPWWQFSGIALAAIVMVGFYIFSALSPLGGGFEEPLPVEAEYAPLEEAIQEAPDTADGPDYWKDTDS